VIRRVAVELCPGAQPEQLDPVDAELAPTVGEVCDHRPGHREAGVEIVELGRTDALPAALFR